ncbi:hypothetical protein PSYAE_25047 [Pseudomonas amygdali pv. aesculi str. 0893_23]|nr:hypothetical protein PSYAE_25047 [Pseudomonas amygdali pv. aesculi str. 0893_23]KPW26020.1 hypothetical protein ALO90_103053 [Pseudomonas amygdali pv. aesculi]
MIREAETQDDSSFSICFASKCCQSKNTEVLKMIVGINRLKQFGIFSDFNGTKIQKFWPIQPCLWLERNRQVNPFESIFLL